ncbi:uncharacterized protein A4U43_C09F14400 [Asparagus officinalis]|uniref:Nicastrin n=1 Tax=Asparagus officinalis TaxID=4686 RepID=A0A5P1EAU2_ASPOF|nr:nicastrin [Asparagus officinalis]ONK58567.1 uncharacterized protein A4U43_C09F14400 [Asparagus officinalis]
MAKSPPPMLLSILLFLIPTHRVNGESSTLESVPDLEKAMYLNLEAYACVRLLNLSGEIGCSNPGRGKVVAPISRLKDAQDQLAGARALLVPLAEMRSFFHRVSNDPHFAKNIAGVLVDSTGPQKILAGFSPAEKFPQAEFAPYRDLSYGWNLAGSGIMRNHYNFPVFLLSEESTSMVQETVATNEKSKNAYPVGVAEFDLAMQTTNAGTRDSESCLRERTCLPLGGYSVWSSLPPINVSSLESPKPILMVLASQDSASFFRDKSLGADSPLSGLIAMLAAVDALSHVDGLDEFKKQIVFAVFTGEAWGYLGSRRFLHELDLSADAVNGLNGTMIEQVLEMGSVGKGFGQGATTFYAHLQGDSSARKEILSAFQTASNSLGSDNVNVKAADESNPGVPPSSIMSFLRKNSSVSGVVLEDFDTSFANKFYHSHLDNPSNINSSSVAVLVARAIYVMASGRSPLDLMTLNSIKVNVSMVEELVGCLLTCDPGLSCDIVKNFISPSSSCPNHYVGVFLDSPSDTEHPQYATDTSRFVWNFLAEKTSTPKNNLSSCTGECSNSYEVCIGAETNGGRCVISTTRYIPAYSTRLKFEDGSWHVMPVDASDSMGAVDPVWTESFWDTIGVRVYTVQSSSYDRLILVAGVILTVSSYIAATYIRNYLSKALKRD